MTTATATGPSTWDRVRGYSPPSRYAPVLATLALFVGLFGLGGLRYEGFADPQVFLSLLLDNAFLIVLAVGMTFVILTGGIDLSVGSVVALSTMIAAKTLEMGWSPYLSIGAVLVVGTTIGLADGPAHPLLRHPALHRDPGGHVPGARHLLPDQRRVHPDHRRDVRRLRLLDDHPAGRLLHDLDGRGGARRRWPSRRTSWPAPRFGRTVYAIGGSESSAMLMGLRVAFTKVGVYAISGFCAALGGLLFALYTLSGYSLHAVGMELDAIAAVVIGGTLLTGGRGYVVGSLLGVLVLGTIQTYISFDGTLSSWWTKIVIGVLLLVFVVIQRFATRRQP